jgi:hypothetical protein
VSKKILPEYPELMSQLEYEKPSPVPLTTESISVTSNVSVPEYPVSHLQNGDIVFGKTVSVSAVDAIGSEAVLPVLKHDRMLIAANTAAASTVVMAIAVIVFVLTH